VVAGGVIDLRSDVCSPPTDEMWTAMRAAPLGWASIGEDPSVLRLETLGASLLGKEAAVWVPTCGMANLAALLTLTDPGDAVVLPDDAHVLTSEGMWITEVASLRPVRIPAAGGRCDPADVDEALAASGASVLLLENTHTRAGGTVLSVEAGKEIERAARRHGARVHLDGARLVNAAAALGAPLEALAAPADTVALSLNKGLCAPMGTLLAGAGATMAEARRRLRALGGATVHKAGIAAAAGIVALETMRDRLPEDHRRARALGDGLRGLPGLRVAPDPIETNIVLVDLSSTGTRADGFARRLAESGVRALVVDDDRIRLVTHRTIGDAEVERALAVCRGVVAKL
jgi:threonine aldolase